MKFIVDWMPTTKERCPLSYIDEELNNDRCCRLDRYPCNLLIKKDDFSRCRWLETIHEWRII